ncbi:MAG TPA: hypothetical protein VHE61_01215 [Opitutaceae bacterium]|nr:hypothetical protein [Opitutaceae bacterium]
MRKSFRLLSLVLAALALSSTAIMVVGDTRHSFAPSSFHAQVGAFALMFVGVSYILAQVTRRVSIGERLRAMLLGGAFVLWGAEQFLQPGKLVTILDIAVIGIFVVDLFLIILAMHRD